MEYLRNDELLSAYLDRELSPDERAAVDRLLEQSPEARERLRELEVTSRIVRRLPQIGVETDLSESVVDRLRNESLLRPPPVEPVRRSHHFSWRISGPLAAAAILMIAVWLMYRPDRTDFGPLASNAAASDRWEQLDAGDFFDLVGPDGESQYQLIVVGRKLDAVRCFLIDRTDLDKVSESESRDRQSNNSSGINGSTLALQANRDQLEALEKAYALASSLEAEPFPIVDINVRADGLAVDDLKAHTRFAGTQPALTQVPNELAKDASSIAGLETPRSRTSDSPAMPNAASATELAQTTPGGQTEGKNLGQTEGANSDMEPAKSELSATAPATVVSQSERSQKQVIGRIESVTQRSEDSSSDKRTRDSVKGLVDVGKDRIGPGTKGKHPGRVEVLLQLKRQSDSDR